MLVFPKSNQQFMSYRAGYLLLTFSCLIAQSDGTQLMYSFIHNHQSFKLFFF